MRNTIRRDALSLMELIVVLSVLVLLGGLIVAVLPNVMKRAHLAKCADTIAALNSAWMRAYALNVRYPDVYDSLLSAGGTTIDSRLSPGLLSQTSVTTLSAEDVAALRSIGITAVVDLMPTPPGGSVTYDSAPVGAPQRRLTVGGRVVQLNLSNHLAAGNPLNLKRHLVRLADGSLADNSSNVRYLIFGIGPNCTGVGTGKLIQEAPVHFAADDSLNPTNVYQRYLVVFSLVTNVNGTVTAYFESAAGNDVNGPSSADAHIRQFHDSASTDG
ncbi:MAG: hypothetical protein NZ700_02135 [Gemmataceae bacterium]|nr:hypothetical protein [Gemmataceae bacterium]MDW8265270.1 hypothetical protein [Gemmataceae bacterium]